MRSTSAHPRRDRPDRLVHCRGPRIVPEGSQDPGRRIAQPPGDWRSDYFLRPGGGYYGTKKACVPVHVQYSYDDRSVAVVNDFHQGFKGLKVSAEVFNLDLASKFSQAAV